MIRKRLLPQFQGMLAMMGITRTDGKALDAAETGFIAKQLEYVMAETYSVQYGPSLARLFIPIDTSVPPGAETFAYDQWDHVGLAKIITAWSDDLPKVEAFVKRFTAQCKSLGDSYEFTVQDVRAIQFSRGRLNDERAIAARMAIDNMIDLLAAEGNAEHGLKGFINHDAVPIVTPAYGAWTETTAVASILADLAKLDNAVITNTRTLIKPDTRLFSTKDFAILQRPVGAEFSKTILQAYMSNSTYIKFADQWPSLDTAGEDGFSRTIAYKRDKMVAAFVITIEFTQHPPQQKNLAFQVPCEARVGGVTVKYPLGMAYMDTHTTP